MSIYKGIVVVLLGAMLFSSHVSAAKDPCQDISKLATGIMKYRQQGMSLADFVEVTDKQEDNSLKSAAKKLIFEAYRVPQYDSEKFRQKAVREFADKAYLDCAT